MRPTLLIALAFALLASPARAQDEVDSARGLFEEGLAQFDTGDLGRAEELFRRSLEVRRSSAAAFNLARVLEQNGGLAEARDLFEEVAGADGVPPPILAQARARVTALDARVANVIVRADNPAVEARIDGDRVPLGVARRLDPGEHVVTARFGDYVLRDERVHLDEGETRTFHVGEIPAQAMEPDTVIVERSDDTAIIVLVVVLAVTLLAGAAVGIGVAASQGCDAGNVLDMCIRAGM